MKRTISYKIDSKYNNEKISTFLKAQGYSAKMRTTLRHQEGSLFLNKKEVHMNAKGAKGDLLEIVLVEHNTSEKVLPVNLPIEIVYEDEDILVVNKPANMPSHPSMKNYENTLGNAVEYYFEQKNLDIAFRCVNRLDKNTTGLTIIAKHKISCGILYDEIKANLIDREYVAIVEGTFNEKKGTVNMPIARMEGSTIMRKIDKENGQTAITNYEVISQNETHSLVKFHLETGRTHQIRVHMAAVGHPLIGDHLYNPNNTELERQALHARALSFIHPITKEQLSFEVDFPEDMKQFIAENFELPK